MHTLILAVLTKDTNSDPKIVSGIIYLISTSLYTLKLSSLQWIVEISPYAHSCRLHVPLTYYLILLSRFVLHYATSFTFFTFSVNSCKFVNLLGFLAFCIFYL